MWQVRMVRTRDKRGKDLKVEYREIYTNNQGDVLSYCEKPVSLARCVHSEDLLLLTEQINKASKLPIVECVKT